MDVDIDYNIDIAMDYFTPLMGLYCTIGEDESIFPFAWGAVPVVECKLL